MVKENPDIIKTIEVNSVEEFLSEQKLYSRQTILEGIRLLIISSSHL